MQKPLVSIIIPTYNRAHIIDETLHSVLSQSYDNWECIVVDDVSTDDTESTMRLFLEKDPRIHFCTRPENSPKGPSACRNFGYDQSKGEFIQWFDSDDLMHPHKLKLKVETALEHDADVIIDKHSGDALELDVQDFKIDSFTSKDFFIDFLLGKKPVITNDVMFKRTIIGNNRFDENLWKGEEYEFYGRVFQQKLTYCFMDVSLTRYQLSEDSLSISPKQTESLIYLSKKLQTAHANNPLIVEKAKYQGRKTYKDSILKNKLAMVFKYFSFFKICHHKSSIVFLAFIIYNFITKSGFDIIKPKNTKM